MTALELTHGFTIDAQKCKGRLACMRACSTEAIRVRNGKAQVIADLCIDCGACLLACPSGAIQATTRSLAEIDSYRYKIALPSPILFGQFPRAFTPAQMAAGLSRCGFDVVCDFSVELALVNRAVRDYVEQWRGPQPLLSNWCPVVVRLVQVLYPSMVEQLLPIQVPRELAGRTMRKKYSRELSIDPGEIAVVYITPCQAKTLSIRAPAEGGHSNLNGALGISDVYNDIMASLHSLKENGDESSVPAFSCGAEMLRWSLPEAQSHVLSRDGYLSVTGLANITRVFDDIEKGKLRNIEYLECYACWSGCANGNLTVDNVYVTLSRLYHLLAKLPASDPELEAEVERRVPMEDFSLASPIRPRSMESQTWEVKGPDGTGPTAGRKCDLRERVRWVKRREALVEALPGLNCGLCGSPTCDAFAGDVADGTVGLSQCVMFSDARLREVRSTYMSRRRSPPDD